MNPDTTILIVDDEPLGRETLAGLLQAYQLVFACNGVEALEQAAATAPDLILLDVMMPGMDGYQVCRQIRVTPLLAEVPIVMVTALDDRDSRLAGIEAGADDFISKPYDRIELRARVHTITRLNRYRRLVSARSKFEWVVEQSDEGYLVVTANGTISYANPRARLYLGARLEGQIDDTFLDLVSHQYRLEPHTSWANWFGAVPHKRSAPRMLIRPASDTADNVILHVTLLEMASDPGPCCLVRLRDVTASLAGQHTVWSFQSLIRHKLSTSLAQLIGGMRLIEGLNLAPAQGTLAEMLTIVSHGATNLQSDINDIFQYISVPDLIQSERGRCTLAELPSIIADINTDLKIALIELPGDEQCALDTHELGIARRGLRLILGELLENARKFHPHHNPTIEIAVAREHDALHIYVRDDGGSLAPDQLAQAWLPYYQGERSFTGHVPGMGLGLSMVANLLWQIGGSCRISNRAPGPGVEVEVCLPLVERLEQQAPATQP